MPDIIVTTPKRFLKEARAEAEHAKTLFHATGERTQYFRSFPFSLLRWPDLFHGDRIYYVEDGWVRGFLVVDFAQEQVDGQTCGTHGVAWPAGYYAYLWADSWKWIVPLPMKGFQGWRWAHRAGVVRESVKVAGDWLDPMPNPDPMPDVER